jgi:hypothetical protein
LSADAVSGSSGGLWPCVEDVVPPDLPPDVAVARLVALARTLLIENRELREALELARERPAPELLDALRPRDSRRSAEAA